MDAFSPVIRPLSVRLVLTLLVTNGWRVKQLDISNAFIHGKLEEWIIVSQPFGFHNSDAPDHVCLLRKYLYGLNKVLDVGL